MRKLCAMPYLASTPEVQVFLRPKGKVEDSFKNMGKTNTDMVLAFYKQKIKVSNYNLPEGQLAKYSADVNEFVKEQKALMDHLKNFKTHIHQIVPMKEQELKYYKQFADFLQKYEDANEK